MKSNIITRTLTLPMKRWFPAEYGSNQKLACVMIYPHNRYTFRITRAREQFVNIVHAIRYHGKEDVIVLCHSNDDILSLQHDLDQKQQIDDDVTKNNETMGGNVVIPLVCPSSDAWARDSLPTFVVPVPTEKKQEDNDDSNANVTTILGLNWIFNGWGNKLSHDDMFDDLRIKENIIPILNQYYASKNMQFVSEPVSIVLEGGSIHTDGCGTILATEECLLHTNRNPTLTKHQIEQIILQSTGCHRMIWLPHGVAHDDDTDGHIDNFVCFVTPTTVLLAWTDLLEEDPENYHRCRTALSILQNTMDHNGNPLIIHQLHLPKPLYYTEEILHDIMSQLDSDEQSADDHDVANSILYNRPVGKQMAGSYINFYIANYAIIVPQFHDSIYDSLAIETIKPLFPHHQIIGVYSDELLIGGGNIHCMTQQIPSPFGTQQ
jgi:agmatine deiminase